MLESIKKNAHYFIYLILLIVLGWVFQSSEKKYELLETKSKIEISKLNEESFKLKSQITSLEKSTIVLQNSLKKANKQLHVIIKKGADGSYSKEIISNSNSEQSNNNIFIYL